jgi:hypothetical protein
VQADSAQEYRGRRESNTAPSIAVALAPKLQKMAVNVAMVVVTFGVVTLSLAALLLYLFRHVFLPSRTAAADNGPKSEVDSHTGKSPLQASPLPLSWPCCVRQVTGTSFQPVGRQGSIIGDARCTPHVINPSPYVKNPGPDRYMEADV